MIDIRDYTEQIKRGYDITNSDFNFEFSKFFVDNNWFGYKPVVENGKVFVSENFVKRNKDKINDFCKHYDLDLIQKKDILLKKMKKTFPETYKKFMKFRKCPDLLNTKYRTCTIEIPNSPYRELTDECVYYLVDYMLYRLAGELETSTNQELYDFVSDSSNSITYAYQLILQAFIAWVHFNYKTVYTELYYLKTTVTENSSSEAYDANFYLDMLYHLFNEEYIKKNDMYTKAARSKEFIDTWLSLSMRCLNCLRDTDSARIPHPTIFDTPENVLCKVINNEFSDAEALQVLNTVIWELQLLCLTPNKTKRTSNGETIRFEIPHSVQTHLGRLFAIAEAHSQLSDSNRESFIKKIARYRDIERNMGVEIGELFRKGDFRTRSANKSYMQAVQMLTGSILDVDDTFNVKGYILASFARTHKSKYGSFAAVTSKYLKDAKMSGFTAEFVAKELVERGVLSSIPSTLLNLISDGEYKKLSVHHQTKMIKTLNMSPKEVENIVSVYEKNKKQSIEIATSIYNNTSKENVLLILHNIANGNAASKKTQSLCLLTAMGKLCPNRNNCTGCKYEIGTKSTLIAMKNELYRLKNEYNNSTNEIDKSRNKFLALNVVAPSIQELLTCYEEQYGSEEVKKLELILKENTYE